MYLNDFTRGIVTLISSIVTLIVLFLLAIADTAIGLIYGLGIGYLLFMLGHESITNLFELFGIAMTQYHFMSLMSLIGGVAGFVQNGFMLPKIVFEDDELLDEEDF